MFTNASFLFLRLAPAADDVLTDDVTSGDWIRAGSIVVGSLIVAVAVNRIARSMLSKAFRSTFAAVITARLLAYVLFLLGLLYALNALGVRIGPLLGALGLGGLVLALALQKVVENFVGSIILQTRRPFTLGDTVELDERIGVVTDIDARTTVLRALDGSMIRIPNGEVLSSSIVNLTRERFRRSQVQVGVAYDSNLEQARQVLIDATNRVQRVVRDPAPRVVLTQFGASSIDFTVYYWHVSDVPSELEATHDVILAIHHGLADAGITIAFPQMVVWSGRSAAQNPYGDAPGEVYTEHPDSSPGSASGAAERPSRWNRRRRSE